jgi:hypothetical protein
LKYVSTDKIWADGALKPLAVTKKFEEYQKVVQGVQLLLDYKTTSGH